MRGSLFQVGLNLLAAHASVGFDTQVFYLTIADGHVTLQPKSTAQFALVSRTSPQVYNRSIYGLEPKRFYHTLLAAVRAGFTQVLQIHNTDLTGHADTVN